MIDPLLIFLGGFALGAIAATFIIFMHGGWDEEFEIERGIHNQVLKCIRCGAPIDSPLVTMTRDEWYCEYCKIDNAVADAHEEERP